MNVYTSYETNSSKLQLSKRCFFSKLEIIISNFSPAKMGALVLKLQEVALTLIRDYILYMI